MAEKRVQRKLAAILAADVVGYARLMREDEEATLRTLTEYREVIAGLIDRHDGRVFNTGGDSLLAEFGSVVEAVRCAISFQEEIANCNTELPDDRKLRFRIGINVGDVMVKGDDLFGDGVNIAARLEGLAEPAGICISGSVFEQIEHKLSLGFEDLGPQQVKDISEPVSAFRIVSGSVTVAAGAGVATRPSSAGRWQMSAFAAVALLIVGLGVAVLWRTLLPPPQEPRKTGTATGTAAPVRWLLTLEEADRQGAWRGLDILHFSAGRPTAKHTYAKARIPLIRNKQDMIADRSWPPKTAGEA